MSADGKWNVTVNTPMGPQSSDVEITTNGATFTGKASRAGSPAVEVSGTVSGNTLNWKQDITQPMPMTLEFTATVDGDNMTGSVKLGAFGNASLTGKRA